MAQSKTKELLARLEAAADDLKKRYEALVRKSDAGYQNQLRTLEEDYHASALAASADAKIGLKNSLERMADAGYSNAGETVQATIAANTERNRALSALERQKARDKAALMQSQEEARASLAMEGEKEAAALRQTATEIAVEEERAQRELAAAEAQRSFENSIKLQNLALEKAKAEAENGKGALTPEKSPYEYVDEIVKMNTTYKKKRARRSWIGRRSFWRSPRS